MCNPGRFKSLEGYGVCIYSIKPQEPKAKICLKINSLILFRLLCICHDFRWVDSYLLLTIPVREHLKIKCNISISNDLVFSAQGRMISKSCCSVIQKCKRTAIFCHNMAAMRPKCQILQHFQLHPSTESTFTQRILHRLFICGKDH